MGRVDQHALVIGPAFAQAGLQGDAQMAAICRTRGAALATRNAKDFRETGIDVIDPWQEG